MEKLRIGIALGNNEGANFDNLLQTLDDPAITEVCTPILYGDTVAVIARSKDLQMNISAKSINSSADIVDGKFCMMNIAEEGAQATRDAAFNDWEQGDTDVLVAMPQSNDIEMNAMELRGLDMLMAGNLRIAFADAGEDLHEQLRMLQDTMYRDFCIKRPRIALIGDNMRLLVQHVEESNPSDIVVGGIYQWEDFFDQNKRMFSAFDVVLTDDVENAKKYFADIANDNGIAYTAGKDLICTTPCMPEAVATSLFTAVDILRNREAYDKSHEDVLPKLFHDKREEKGLRFS